jgi:hypothetical protein
VLSDIKDIYAIDPARITTLMENCRVALIEMGTVANTQEAVVVLLNLIVEIVSNSTSPRIVSITAIHLEAVAEQLRALGGPAAGTC